MSGKFKVILKDGSQYAANSDQEFDQMMQEFSASGDEPRWEEIKESAGPDPDTYVDEMNVLGSNETPAPPSPPPKPASEPQSPSVMDSLRSVYREHIKPTIQQPLDTLADTAHGVTQGATLGWGDELAKGISPRYGEQVAARLAQAKGRSPWGYETGQALGSLGAALIPGAGAAGWTPMLTNTAMGAASAAGNAPEGQKTNAALSGGTLAAGLSSLIPGLGKAASSIGNIPKVAQRLRQDAQGARNEVLGLTVAETDELIKQGKDPEMFGKLLDKYLPHGGLGQSARQYRERLQPLVDSEGSLHNQLVKEAGEAGANKGLRLKYNTVAEALKTEGERLKQYQNTTDQDASLARGYLRAAARDAEALPPRTTEDLLRKKSAHQAQGHTGAMGSVPDQAAKQVATFTGEQEKRLLEEVMGTQPGTNERWLESRGKLQEMLPLLRQLTEQEARERTSAGLGKMIANVGAASASGAVPGLISGLATGHPITGALAGAGTGAMAGAYTGTNPLAQRFIGSRGSDTSAQLMNRLAEKLPKMRTFPAAQAAGATIQGIANPAIRASVGKSAAEPSQAITSADKVLRALETDPETLGQFRAQLEPFLSDPDDLAREVERLEQDDKLGQAFRTLPIFGGTP